MRTRTLPADPLTVGSRGSADRRRVVVARAAALGGAASAIAFQALVPLVTPTQEPFRHAVDYWYTAIGMLPMMAAPLVLVVALHRLQHGHDGRPGTIGTVLAAASFTVFLGMGTAAMVMGRASSFGPTYVIVLVVNLIGITLVAIGSWRSGLLQGWLAALWAVAWTIGGPIPFLPLLLVIPYLLLAARLPGRIANLPRRDSES